MRRALPMRCLWLVLGLAVGTAAAAETVCSAGGGAFDPGTGGTGLQAGIGTGGTGVDAAPGQGTTGWPPAARRDDPGGGGTGIGTGGTGQLADPGTGGTGIVGVITGFASVCVNGIEAEFDARTVIVDNGRPAGPASLKVGQVVHVQATGRGARVFARRIDVADLLVGPVTRVDVANRRVEVMHQPVRWRDAPGASPLGDLRPGQFVRVSGFRAAGGEVLASRVDRAPAGPVRLTGAIEATRGRALDVQGVRVETAALEVTPSRETVVRVEGQWQGDAIAAARVTPATIDFGRDVAAVSVQGVVAAQGGEIRVDGLRVPLGTLASVEGGDGTRLRDGEVVQVEAAVRDDGKFDVRKLMRGERVAHGGGSGDRDDDARGDDAGSRLDDGEREESEASRGDDRDESGSRRGEEADGADARRDDSTQRGRDGAGSDRGDDRVRPERDDARAERDSVRRESSGHGGEAREAGRHDRAEVRIRDGGRGDGRAARTERVDRVERVGRAARVERVERVDRVDRAERLDTGGRHGRDR